MWTHTPLLTPLTASACAPAVRSTASASMQGMQGMQGTRHLHATATVSPAMGGGQGTGEKRARAPDMTDTLQPAIPFEAGAPAACAGDWGGGGDSGGGRRHSRHMTYPHGHMPYSPHMPYSLPAAPLPAGPLHPLAPLSPVDSGVGGERGVGGVEPAALPRDMALLNHLPRDLPLHSQRQLLLVFVPPSLSSFPLPLPLPIPLPLLLPAPSLLPHPRCLACLLGDEGADARGGREAQAARRRETLFRLLAAALPPHLQSVLQSACHSGVSGCPCVRACVHCVHDESFMGFCERARAGGKKSLSFSPP